VTAGHLVFSFSIAASSPTRLKIEKINNLFQVDINRSEQGCAAYYEQHCQHVVTALFNCTVTTWNNMVDNLFIVGRTTLFTPVDINLEQPVRF
jgi:hypothetical protein